MTFEFAPAAIISLHLDILNISFLAKIMIFDNTVNLIDYFVCSFIPEFNQSIVGTSDQHVILDENFINSFRVCSRNVTDHFYLRFG
jgi:hypothetical protein